MSWNGKYPKWNGKSDAAKKLTAQVANGDIEPTSPPKTVWMSDPVCMDFPLANFRAALTRERAKAGSFLTNRK